MARMTYMGQCMIGERIMLCTNMGSSIQASAQFHNHVAGLRDKGLDGSGIKMAAADDDDSVGGDKQIQRRIYRYAPAVIRCKISGPVASIDGETNIKSLLEDHAIRGKKIEEMTLTYFGSFGGNIEGHKMEGLYVESMNLNVSAGDIVSYDVEMVAKNRIIEEGKSTQVAPCQKLVTWDRVQITSDVEGDYQAFSLSIKNNLNIIYTSSEDQGSSFIKAKDIRFGTQTVEGTLSTYIFNTWQTPPEGNGHITFDIDDLKWKINTIYEPTPSEAGGGVYVAPVPFRGVSDGPVWEQQ
jgi:hypothetical protein